MPDDDPGLPIKFGPCSNGEYVPAPLTPVEREAIRRARHAADQNARRLGVTRGDFLRSVCGAATTLLALQGCAGEAARHLLGGGWEVPPEAGLDADAARAVLAGEEFVFDVQGHHLEYDLMRRSAGKPFFGSVFPQVNCGLDDPRACFSREVFLEDFFLRSDTSMVTLSALPIASRGSPLSAAIMETRHTAELVCHWDSVLLHAQVLPNYGPVQANLDEMERNARRYPIAAWKVFTHFPDAFGDPGNAWRLDDADRRLPQVGHAFIEQARRLGVKTICAHKGFGAGSRYASPEDVPRAAKESPTSTSSSTTRATSAPGRAKGHSRRRPRIWASTACWRRCAGTGWGPTRTSTPSSARPGGRSCATQSRLRTFSASSSATSARTTSSGARTASSTARPRIRSRPSAPSGSVPTSRSDTATRR